MSVSKEMKEIRKHYNIWIEEIINVYSERFGNMGDKNFSSKNILFVTIMMERPYDDMLPSREYEISAFRSLFNLVCKKVVSRHYNNKVHRNLVPIAIGFLDAKNTKYAKKMSKLEGMHIHSVWSCSNFNIENIEVAILSEDVKEKLKKRYRIKSIDVRRASDTKKLIDYAQKLNFITESLDLSEVFEVCPGWAN